MTTTGEPGYQLIDPDEVSEFESAWLARFDQQLRRDPGTFLAALRHVGTTALRVDRASVTTDTADHLEPTHLLEDYFAQRRDRNLEYDTATEAAIRRTSPPRTATGQLRYKTGTMSSEYRPNPRADSERDLNRVHRLETYLARLLEIHHEAANTLPKSPALPEVV